MSSATADSEVTIKIPAWVDHAVRDVGDLRDVRARMDMVIQLSRLNIAHGGGPFAAAVFDNHRLVAAGVNRVVATGYSIAHAEIVALLRAQKKLGKAWNSKAGRLSLVTSTEPCCQCFGALVWSGVTALVCGATTGDAQSIGFDEGPKPAGWVRILRTRGVTVLQRVRRGEAKSVIDDYSRMGGVIY